MAELDTDMDFASVSNWIIYKPAFTKFFSLQFLIWATFQYLFQLICSLFFHVFKESPFISVHML